jgi:hypothetical protein
MPHYNTQLSVTPLLFTFFDTSFSSMHIQTTDGNSSFIFQYQSVIIINFQASGRTKIEIEKDGKGLRDFTVSVSIIK